MGFVGLPIFIVLLAVFVLMALPILSRRIHGRVSYINPFDLKQRLKGGEAFIILDIRSAAEFNRAHIAGAVNVKRQRLANGFDPADIGIDLGPGEIRPIVIVCQSDLDSIRAAKVLERGGNTEVLVMKGGLFRWKREHLPLEKQQ